MGEVCRSGEGNVGHCWKWNSRVAYVMCPHAPL